MSCNPTSIIIKENKYWYLCPWLLPILGFVAIFGGSQSERDGLMVFQCPGQHANDETVARRGHTRAQQVKIRQGRAFNSTVTECKYFFVMIICIHHCGGGGGAGQHQQIFNSALDWLQVISLFATPTTRWICLHWLGSQHQEKQWAF